jgi:hypothetical protein
MIMSRSTAEAGFDGVEELTLPDLDPVLVLELLPPKILARRRRIADIAIDLSIARENAFVGGVEIGELVRELRLHQAMLEAYERRLESTRQAANGKQV